MPGQEGVPGQAFEDVHPDAVQQDEYEVVGIPDSSLYVEGVCRHLTRGHAQKPRDGPSQVNDVRLFVPWAHERSGLEGP